MFVRANSFAYSLVEFQPGLNPMRVAFLVWQFPVLSETFVINQIVGVLARGHEVDIYACKAGDWNHVHPDVETYQLRNRTHYLPQPSPNLLQRALQGIELLGKNFVKAPIPTLRSLNVCKYGLPAVSLTFLHQITPFLNQLPYDVIHAQFGTDGLRGLQLKELGALQGKLVTTFRGFDISWYVREYGETFYDRLFQSGDYFLTNCEFFRQRLLTLGANPAKTEVHYSGLDCDRFRFTPRYPSADGTIRITTTGRLVEKKGIEYVIRAVAKLAPTYPNLEYIIIGEGELRAQFEQLVHDFGLTEIVKLVGEKSQPELIEILDRSHIFVAPSITAQDGNQDAPINVLKEAMAMGLPVISTTHGGIPELVQHRVSGLLVPERDADALAETLADLIEHPDQWVAFGRAGRSAVEAKFDLQRLNDRLIDLYQQLCQPLTRVTQETVLEPLSAQSRMLL